jgi:hypothetical protein
MPDLKMLQALSENLDRDLLSFLLNLETFRPSDRNAFAKIEQQAADVARALKGADVLPRTLLNNIFRAIGIIRAQVSHQKEWQRELDDMANRLEMIFGLILAGETPDDRIPGVPRTI